MAKFIISLDFELLWGVRDTRGSEYHQQLLNVHQVVPALLALFEKYDVACTWATVGALCAESVEQFNLIKPDITPTYVVDKFSPYPFLTTLFELNNELLFAPDLICQILATPKQELASHTFCHYYCLEDGQTIEQFKEDLRVNAKVADYFDVTFRSLIFPRNQFNKDYLNACADTGLICYRGNPEHWAYKAESRGQQSIFKRAFRLLDAYFPFSGSLRQQVKMDELNYIVDIPASLFLRPWSNRFRFLEPIRLWRVKWSMTRTARKGGVFHLWWHPHNFGINMVDNLKFLENILKHYSKLNSEHGYQSATMENVAFQFKNNKVNLGE